MMKGLVFGTVVAAVVLAMFLPAATIQAAPPARGCDGASVWISSPAPGSTVSGTFAIMGSASLPGGQFRYYKVQLSVAGQNSWFDVINGVPSPVVNGQLALLNADTLAPGDYTLRVLAIDPSANYCEAFASPIHVAPGAPTPAPSPTPAASPTPNPSATPKGTPAANGQAASGAVTPTPAGTPTIAIQIPTAQPGSDPLLTGSKTTSNLLSSLPTAQLGSMGESVVGWAGSLGHQFVFGMQLTAGLFILLGVIAFLRRNL